MRLNKLKNDKKNLKIRYQKPYMRLPIVQIFFKTHQIERFNYKLYLKEHLIIRFINGQQGIIAKTKEILEQNKIKGIEISQLTKIPNS